MRSRRARSQALSAINRARYCSSLTTTPLTPITALLSSSSAAAAAPTHKVIPNLNLINSIPRSVSKSEIVPVVVVGKVEIVDEVVVLAALIDISESIVALSTESIRSDGEQTMPPIIGREEDGSGEEEKDEEWELLSLDRDEMSAS